jgi:hypothetical protein
MTREQVRSIYNEWRQSGETQRAFLTRKQLKQSVFNNYYKYFPVRSAKEKEPGQMLPVQVMANASKSLPMSLELALEFSNGKCLRFPADTSVSYLSRLIGAIESRRRC